MKRLVLVFLATCAAALPAHAQRVRIDVTGAQRAIHASIGTIAIWPSGDSSAVSTRAMKRASTTPPVWRAVHSCKP